MPTYDYRCGACGHLFEHFQSISSPLLRKCPKCGKAKLERLIGPGAGLLFKGSGFYITDYRSKDYHEAAKKDAGTSAPSKDAKSDASSTKSTDSAGDTKSAPKPAAPGSSHSAKGPKKGKR
jgi:putative FmdB family regulatory protein